MKLVLAGVVAVALAAVVLPSETSAQTAATAGSITVYNAQHANLTKSWVDAFTRATGITVIQRDGEDSELGNQIVQEGAASPADVFLTENSPAMVLVDQAKLFEPLPADILKQVPESIRPSSGHWVPIAARSTVFAYNKSKLTPEQLPKSILELAEPKWKGRWAASPAGGDFQAIVSALLELKGEATTEAWLKGMKANATAYRGNSVALKAVNAGQVDAALIYHYYWFGDQARTGENSANTALYYFRHQDPGAFVSLSGGGVLASSRHKPQAEAFLKWITGKDGQEILRTGTSFEYAVGVGAASNPKLVPLPELQAPAVDPSKLNSKKVTDLMTQAGLL
ncbi:MAG TPA: iron ABC transporter substrate-binding protein [Rhodopila sp.]